MRAPIGRAFAAIGAILGSHGLTYLLVGVLPSAAIAALGIFSANQELLSAFSQTAPRRTYLETLADLCAGSLGRTLDGQPVTGELLHALGESAPRFVGAVGILACLSIATALWAGKRTSALQSIADFTSFLPPFLSPFVGLSGILAVEWGLGVSLPRSAYEGVAIVVLSTAGGALLVAQTARITERNLRTDFARSIRAAGATERQVRLRILHNLSAEISPTFEKLAIGLVAALFFAEPILGLSGFGTLATRAVRRSDVDLLLGVTLAAASLVALARVGVAMVRTHYGIEE